MYTRGSRSRTIGLSALERDACVSSLMTFMIFTVVW